MTRAPDNPPFSDWIQRPTMSVAMTYGGVVSIWLIYLFCTLKFPTIFDASPYRLINSGLYCALSAANLGLIGWLLLDLRHAFRADFEVRKGQVSGVMLGFCMLGMLQFGAQTLHRVWDHEGGVDPEKIEAFVNALEPGEALIARVFMEELERLVPDHLLACTSRNNGQLVAINEKRWIGRIEVRDGQMYIEADTKFGAPSTIPNGPWDPVPTRSNFYKLELRVAEAVEQLDNLRTVIGILIER